MGSERSFTVSWCDTHKNWWVTNCPDCMVDANEEYIKREGRKEVVEWLEEHNTMPSFRSLYLMAEDWQQLRKEVLGETKEDS